MSKSPLGVPTAILLVLVLIAGPAVAGGLEIGKAGGDFTLSGPGDSRVSLAGLLSAEEARAVVVVFTSYTCPYSLRADLELLPLLPDFGKEGVVIVSIYPNRHEDDAAMREYASKTGFSHVMIRDPDATVARKYGVEVTPTFFLFDKTGLLRYRGNLTGLTPAVDSVLLGEAVSDPLTPPTGCTVKWPDASVPDSPRPQPEPESAPAPNPDAARLGPRRDGPGGPELSDGAKRWLETLIDHLRTDDPLVRRSAAAAILAIGPAARPALEAARDAAEGPGREELGRLIDRLGRPRDGMAGAGGPGGPGRAGPGGPGGPGGGGRGFSMLPMLRERVGQLPDLTEEQKGDLDKLFEALGEKEADLGRRRDAGEREGLREAYRDLLEEARTGLAGILTKEQLSRFEETGPGRGRRGFGGR